MFWLLLTLLFIDSRVYARPPLRKHCDQALDAPKCISRFYYYCKKGVWVNAGKCSWVNMEKRQDTGQWNAEKHGHKQPGHEQSGQNQHGQNQHGHTHHSNNHQNNNQHNNIQHNNIQHNNNQHHHMPSNNKPPESQPQENKPEGKKEEKSEGGNDGFMISFEELQKAVSACGYNTQVTQSQYDGFRTQVLKNSGICTKVELAMFLTQVLWESGGLEHKVESRCTQEGACDEDYRLESDSPERQYYGRGYIQLTWSNNYKKCSEDIFGDDRLYKHPEKVAEDDELSWATAAWFWKHQVHPKLKDDMFGLTTQYINGFLECKRFRKTDDEEEGQIAPGPNAEKSELRFKNYEKVYAAFGLPGEPKDGGCMEKIPHEFTKPV